MGHSQVLLSAADLAFTAAGYLARPSHDAKASVVLMRKLGVAVTSLQAAISDPDECMSADVLAAVSLLSSYEVRNLARIVYWSSGLIKPVSQIDERSSLDEPSQRSIQTA